MLDTSQQTAVENIAKLSEHVQLLIGAGGSGKTFTIQHLLRMLWDDPDSGINPEKTFLAAPTGKAAKVLNSSLAADNFRVWNEASTIHRLLGYRPGSGWTYNVSNKLPARLVIVDEASMVDSLLLSRVIDALPNECHLILVGDDNQLPPVAAGQPFTDLILYGPRTIINRLTTNHRQQQGSLIANACLSVLGGDMPTFGKKGDRTLGGTLDDDLFFIEQEDKEKIPEIVADLCREWHDQGEDYIVLAPQKTGVCGVEAINEYLQEELNPWRDDKPQLKFGRMILRVGDKVLQTKNNYDLGVFNGFTGIIIGIEEDVVVVDFDGEYITYDKIEHIKQLALGYCMTIHKSQGSQFPYGVLICHSSHYYMWSRSILYTGISRYRKELYVVGEDRALKRGLTNVVSGTRNTLLKLELQREHVEVENDHGA